MTKKIIEFPECWEEIQPQKILHIFKLFTLHSGLPLSYIKMAIVKSLLHLKRPIVGDRSEQYFILVDELSKTIDWMFFVDKEIWGINYNNPINVIPKIGTLMGPSGAASDMSFGEFRDALSAFSNFTTCKDTLDLYRLFGILYRKQINKRDQKHENFDGSLREKYNRNLMGQYLKVGAKRKPEELLYAFVWFGAFAQYLFTGGEFCLNGQNGIPISFVEIFNSSDKEKNNILGMNNIIFSIAEEGAMGNFKDVENANLFIVLQKLMHDHFKAEDIKKQMR